ncbi:MIP/aquaporin family protein [Nesterenkonia sp. NBAIMH1]|uniref:MIP/aquaporin family protein n=1 Tax=Nesterenkonia sp. NBAIMH1 TaxID=2600320 RepID=UPI0011B75E47|nr:MIP/aquaporin family protein [Nesterenkonia sp. NBAIMH1]
METIFLFEIMGTATLILLGTGVVANALLPGTKGHAGGPLMIHFGWGLAVFSGVYVAWASGAHINPAVTLGIFVSGESEFADGITANVPHMLAYFAAQVIGAFVGAVLAWAAYKKHYDKAEDPGVIKGTFCTDPAERHYGWNVVTEVIATYVLVLVVLLFGATPSELGPLAVGLLVVGIGAGLGGPTGYAINPARDLGPRLAHALLPIRNKGGNDWAYSWVPIVGPLAGAVLAGLTAPILLAG